MRKHRKVLLYLLCIIIIGTILRLHALSAYKFYADGYVPLVVAENIRTYGSVLGTLGPYGMIYPDFVSWTRPLYPLLILCFDFFYNNLETSARIVSLLAGLAAIPLAYLYVSSALRSRIAGLLGSLSLALSYNHAVWGGFILSDTTGVLCLTALLLVLFRSREKKHSTADLGDLLAGALFALAVLARYEYIILVLPLVYLLRSPMKLLNMGAGASLVWALAYFFLSPFTVGSAGVSQAGSLLDTPGLDITGIRGFILSDIVLALTSLSGFWLMLREESSRRIALFSLSSILLLGLTYYQINPSMQRYSMHLLPFLLLPASFALTYAAAWLRGQNRARLYAASVLLMAVFAWQFFFTYRGLRTADEGVWFQPGYEESAAKSIKARLDSLDPARSALLIASFPEPYFLYDHRSVQSISPEPPFVFISDSSDYETMIVEDEGMRRIFPQFTAFLKSRFFIEQIENNPTEIPFSSVFRYGTEIERTDEPIRLYKLRLSALKQAINQYDQINNPNTLLQ